MIKTKKQMYTVIGAFVLVMLLTTVTYAFFNYTRTGVANTIKTGRIYFNAEQGDTVTLSDLFPISLEASQEVSSETPGVGSLTLHVTGDTMYDNGIEYLVKAVDVTNSTGGVDLPISIAIKYEETNGNTIGMEDENYYTNRGGNSSLYKVLSNDSITDDGDLVVGYIAKGQTGIDGTITIMAYLDAKNIAISDTYPEGDVTHTETSGETSTEVVDYSNGTTSEWVGDRTVFTTSEWNALQSSGVSFKIKVEANEGIWVEKPKYNCTSGMTSLTNGLTYINGQYKYTYYTDYGWAASLTDYYSTEPITTSLCSTIDNVPIVSLYQLFKDSKTTSIDLSSFDTNDVIDMRSMFEGVELSSLDLYYLETDKVRYMYKMFSNSSIPTLNLSSFNTENVSDMYGMFYNSNIGNLYLDNLNVANVTNAAEMFALSKINNLSFGNEFNFAKLNSMESMFQLSQIPIIDLSAFRTNALTSMYHAFDRCDTNSLIFGDNFNTLNVTDLSYAFRGIQTSMLDLSSFNTTLVTNMNSMFNNATQLTTIIVSNGWNIDNVSNSADMLYNCTSIVGGAGTIYDSSNPTDKTYAIIDGGQSNPGYLTLKTN